MTSKCMNTRQLIFFVSDKANVVLPHLCNEEKTAIQHFLIGQRSKKMRHHTRNMNQTQVLANNNRHAQQIICCLFCRVSIEFPCPVQRLAEDLCFVSPYYLLNPQPAERSPPFQISLPQTFLTMQMQITKLCMVPSLLVPYSTLLFIRDLVKPLSACNTINNIKLMIIAKIRETRIILCSSSP